MPGKAVIRLSAGLEDPEKVTVAFVVALGADESDRPTLMFLTKEAVRLAPDGVMTGIARAGCPPADRANHSGRVMSGSGAVCQAASKAPTSVRAGILMAPRPRKRDPIEPRQAGRGDSAPRNAA
jgi:predicted peroxiredoxin